MTGAHPGFTPSCSHCALQNVCFANGLHHSDLKKLDGLVDRKPSFAKGEHIFKMDDALVAVHAIRSGIVKVYSLHNGEEKIHGFYLPGDIMGMDGIAMKQYLFNAKALEDTNVCTMSLDQLSELSKEVPSLNEQVLALMSKEIVQGRHHASLLTHKSAEEKLAEFIISMMEKFRSRGYDYLHFRLGILHRDVANYLNLTPETVSRILAKFHQEDVITWKKKEVDIYDLEKLYYYARMEPILA